MDTLTSLCFDLGYGGLLYPPNIWGMELTGLIIFTLLQIQRLDLGRRANRNEHANAIQVFSLFTIFALLFYFYYGAFTTYVLIIDMVVGSIGAFFALCELVLGFISVIKFKKASKI